jgi:hypothetical protein
MVKAALVWGFEEVTLCERLRLQNSCLQNSAMTCPFRNMLAGQRGSFPEMIFADGEGNGHGLSFCLLRIANMRR